MDIKIPEVGESILEALVSNWLKEEELWLPRMKSFANLRPTKSMSN